MQFRVTSVSNEETGPPLSDASIKMEDWLNASPSDAHFGGGVNQFVIVAISVDNDPEENARWSNAHNKAGKLKNPFTGMPVRYISAAVLMPPLLVTSKAPVAVLSYFCSSTIERLKLRPKRVPKGFDYERCAEAVSVALEVYIERGPNIALQVSA